MHVAAATLRHHRVSIKFLPATAAPRQAAAVNLMRLTFVVVDFWLCYHGDAPANKDGVT